MAATVKEQVAMYSARFICRDQRHICDLDVGMSCAESARITSHNCGELTRQTCAEAVTIALEAARFAAVAVLLARVGQLASETTCTVAGRAAAAISAALRGRAGRQRLRGS